MKQTWLQVPQQEFAPGLVFTGWKEADFFVFAELIDVDIFTFAKEHQQRLWMLGDTFEIFLRHPDQEAYFEFHIAPNNLRLQLRFPDAGAAARVGRSKQFEEVMMERDAFISRTWVKPEIQRWFVLARIPGRLLDQKDNLSGSQWSFSFCRYDYTREQNVPVISSTSPHRRPDFHRQYEWGTICFE
jgi:hypothetical protein